LDNDKIILSEIDLLDSFFSFAVSNFCCWTNFLDPVYFILDFRYVNFFYGL